MHRMARIFKEKITFGSMVLALLTVTWGTPIAAQTPAGQGSPSVGAISPAAAPEAVFPQTAFNFDSILEGTAVKHDFQVENHGTAVLEIQKVQPD